MMIAIPLRIVSENRFMDIKPTCITWEANPPIEPSSTVIIAGCSLAIRRRRSVSSGLQNRASTTVAETPA